LDYAKYYDPKFGEGLLTAEGSNMAVPEGLELLRTGQVEKSK
jgi:hypothetical protein